MQEQDNGQPLFTILMFMGFIIIIIFIILSIFASEFDYLEWFRHKMIEQFFHR